MKREIILISALIIISILTGCTIQETAPAAVCNKPQINFETGCCIDENSNLICDTDEIEETKQEEETKTGVIQEVTSDHIDFPNSPARFDGKYIFFWEDGIEMKLRYLKSGQAVIKKIWFRQLDCGLEFPDEDKYKLKYWDEVVLEIPCNITKDIIAVNHLELDFEYYNQKSNGSLQPYSSEMQATAEIWGAVRNKETGQPRDPLAKNFLVDECYFAAEQPFVCTKHRIGPDYIEIRLKVDKGGLFVLKTIEWETVPCEYEFEDTSRDAAMTMGDEQVFRISCDIRREYVESYMELVFDEYAPKKIAGKIVEGEYEDEPEQQIVPYAWVSGMVKDE